MGKVEFQVVKWLQALTTRDGSLHAVLLLPPRCLPLSFCQGFTPFLGLESKKRLTFRDATGKSIWKEKLP
jgi:hypothetical protein